MSRFWLHGLMFIFVPNLCYVILDISMAIGFVLTCLAGLLLEIKTILRKSYKSKSLLMISLLFVFVVIWGVYYLLVNGEAKPLLSALIFIPIIYALLVAEILLLANDQQVNDFLASLGMLTFILLALGWAKLIFDLGLGAYAEYPKSLFPFSEDSHFALTLAIFSLGYICGSPQGSILSALVLINILVFGLFLPSLILIILFLIGISIYFLRMGSMVKWGYFIVLIIFSSAGLDFLISFDYFASRLNTEELNNLTLLVWLQGWFIMISSLEATNGLGVGFQALGAQENLLPEFSYLITEITDDGDFRNIEDGGFLAAKIVSEIGILGLFIVVFYLRRLFDGYKILTLKTKKLLLFEQHSARLLCACSGFIFAFFIEMFLRGIGYFSVGLIFFIIASVVLTQSSIINRIP